MKGALDSSTTRAASKAILFGSRPTTGRIKNKVEHTYAQNLLLHFQHSMGAIIREFSEYLK